MMTTLAAIYRCPYTKEALSLQIMRQEGENVIEGLLTSKSGREYAIRDGVAYLLSAKDEPDCAEERQQVQYYDSVGERYEIGLEWLFKSFYADEASSRESMIDLLGLKPDARVLETGCGTCRSSVRIAQRLDAKGSLFLQDLSDNMLTMGKRNLQAELMGSDVPQVEFFMGNACTLPFSDGYFDAAFHFGALNLFADRKAAIAEMTRVVRKGGRVVFGDESVAPWLRDTTYGKILSNSNALYDYPIPLELLPENAEAPCLRWLIGNAFYLFDFTVGEPPKLDLDLTIPGPRGGTHRTRYYGKMEGVHPDTKKRAEDAARQAGMTLHDWLEQAIADQAAKPAAKRT